MFKRFIKGNNGKYLKIKETIGHIILVITVK